MSWYLKILLRGPFFYSNRGELDLCISERKIVTFWVGSDQIQKKKSNLSELPLGRVWTRIPYCWESFHYVWLKKKNLYSWIDKRYDYSICGEIRVFTLFHKVFRLFQTVSSMLPNSSWVNSRMNIVIIIDFFEPIL